MSDTIQPASIEARHGATLRRSFGMGVLAGATACVALAGTSLFHGQGTTKFAGAPGLAPPAAAAGGALAVAASSFRGRPGQALRQAAPQIQPYQRLPAVQLRSRVRLAAAPVDMPFDVSSIEADIMLTPRLFEQLDADRSGTISAEELTAVFGNRTSAESDIKAFMKRADLDGDGEIDYPEFERLMNMQKYGDAQGGNLFARTAVEWGFLKRDSILADGQAALMVGNKGFDPAGYATNLGSLLQYREAEAKHGRLAMLAAVGWPVSELWHGPLSELFGADSLLTANDQAPSLLNGGLDKVSPLFFLSIVVFSAALEYKNVGMEVAPSRRPEDWAPGDLGFDPLSFYKGKPGEEKRSLELKELNNGRLAMVAITSYVLLEFITKGAVVELTPALFGKIL